MSQRYIKRQLQRLNTFLLSSLSDDTTFDDIWGILGTRIVQASGKSSVFLYIHLCCWVLVAFCQTHLVCSWQGMGRCETTKLNLDVAETSTADGTSPYKHFGFFLLKRGLCMELESVKATGQLSRKQVVKLESRGKVSGWSCHTICASIHHPGSAESSFDCSVFCEFFAKRLCSYSASRGTREGAGMGGVRQNSAVGLLSLGF